MFFLYRLVTLKTITISYCLTCLYSGKFFTHSVCWLTVKKQRNYLSGAGNCSTEYFELTVDDEPPKAKDLATANDCSKYLTIILCSVQPVTILGAQLMDLQLCSRSISLITNFVQLMELLLSTSFMWTPLNIIVGKTQFEGWMGMKYRLHFCLLESGGLFWRAKGLIDENYTVCFEVKMRHIYVHL